MCAFPDFTQPGGARVVGRRSTRRLLDAGVAGIWCDMNEPATVRARRSRRCPTTSSITATGEPRLHAEVHNAVRLSGWRRPTREGLARAAAGPPPVRDLARRLRGPAAARAAVDGRQLVVVGAPVDEHAAAAEPRAVRDRLGGRRRRRLLRRLRRRAARALDRVRHLPAVLRNHSAMGTRAAGAVGVRRAVGVDLPRACCGCGCGCCRTCTRLFEECHRTGAPILRPLLFEYPDDPVTYTADDEFLLGSDAAGGADHAAGTRAPARVPARRRRGCTGGRARSSRGRRTSSRTRRWASPPSTCAPTRRSRSAIPFSTCRSPRRLTWRVFAATGGSGAASLYEDAGDGYGPSARRTAHVESGDDGLVRLSLSEREALSYRPVRASRSISAASRSISRRPRSRW